MMTIFNVNANVQDVNIFADNGIKANASASVKLDHILADVYVVAQL